MKKIILLLLVSFCITYSHAQTNATDSLKRLLQKEKTDTGRVLLLVKLSFQYSLSTPDTAMLLAMEALTLSKRIGFIKGEATSLNMIGIASGDLGNYPKAMELYLQALKINEKINNINGLQRNLNNIGIIYLGQEDYRQALKYFLKSKALAEKINDKQSIGASFVNIGHIYYTLKMYDSAILYAQQANNLANTINNLNVIGISLAVMGDIHFETGQNNLALDYYHLSVSYCKKAANNLFLSRSFLGIAKVFEKTGQNDSALFYARQALLIVQGKGFIGQVLDASRFIAHLFETTKILDSAFIYQKITIAANDSLFSQQKQRQLQSLSFDEKLRQQEIASAELKATEERNHNLQYAAIAIGLITFIILFLALSRSIIVKTKFIEFFGVLGLLAVFEFINLFIHPYLAHATNDSPVLMLIILIAIGAMLVPLHHRLEKWMTKVMVEKNKKIRLDAARKTIANLEGKEAK